MVVEGDPAALALASRKALGLSQRAFAEVLGIAQSTVARWESGSHEPTGVGLALFRLILASPNRARSVLSLPDS